MKKWLFVGWACLAVSSARGQMVVGPFDPLFKGVTHAVGTNFPDASIPRLQVAHCIRVDLMDPDVVLFATPPAPSHRYDSRETLCQTVSNFLKLHKLQVVINSGFYQSFPGGADPTSEGLPTEVYGLNISTGIVVSIPDGPPPADQNPRVATLMFKTNKEPVLALNMTNRPTGSNITTYTNIVSYPEVNGIYTAVSGYFAVLTNGVIVPDLEITYPNPSYHDPQPRTCFGISRDHRYLFLMTIDGRQDSYSQGALNSETATWMLRFGAWDAIQMDGGGSAALYRADCAGNPVAVNHSSYIGTGRGRERIVGSHLGIYAKPLVPIYNVSVTPGHTNAVVSWITPTATASQVDYGLTPGSYDSTAFDATEVTNHTVTLTGLMVTTAYYLRIISSNATEYSVLEGCRSFRTTNAPGAVNAMLFGLTKIWKFTSSNLDGINWTLPNYDDGNWSSGPGLLWIDTTTPSAYLDPKNTVLPVSPTTFPYTTYYFRTRFVYTNRLEGLSMTFSNFIDDGAVFYLNGSEILRLRMADSPPPIDNDTLSASSPCLNYPSGNPNRANATTNCPDVIQLTGAALADLHLGTNVLAVEVHNQLVNSKDITFGSALFYALPPPPPPFITNVVVGPGETTALITWETPSNSTSQVEYGLTPSLGTLTPLDSTPVTNHAVNLTGLATLTTYYFRVISTVGATLYTANGSFTTVPFYANVISLTNTWKYSANELDGADWMRLSFDDSTWSDGPALLWVDRNAFPNSLVQPKYTGLPAQATSGNPWVTYYFRTRFTLPALPADSLVFSNYVDDGAVFYLNGKEIYRLRMPAAPTPIFNTTLALGQPLTGDAVSADVFRLGGKAKTNLVVGENLLAVEVHNHALDDLDLTFGSSIGWVRPLPAETNTPPMLHVSNSEGIVCISWLGDGFTLQRSTDLNSSSNWIDVPGPVTTSPYCIEFASATTFYRLRD